MSTRQSAESVGAGRMTIASVRILRLALGTSLSLWFSQAVGWQMSFIAPVFTLLVLGLPLPALKLKQGIGFVAVLAVGLYSGMLLLPMLLEQPAVGLLLLTLALFWSFYFTAKGGSALIGTFATVGLALVAGVGSVNVDALLIVAGDVVFAAAVGVIFVWIAHALMPDSMACLDHRCLDARLGRGRRGAGTATAARGAATRSRQRALERLSFAADCVAGRSVLDAVLIECCVHCRDDQSGLDGAAGDE